IRRRARRRSSMRTRTRSSARAAAAGWCVPARATPVATAARRPAAARLRATSRRAMRGPTGPSSFYDRLVERDEHLRSACFASLDVLCATFGEDVPYRDGLDRGFPY